jgi:hypothetical protein
MPIAMPAASNCITSHDFVSPPSAGVKVMASVPLPGMITSVARYWSP